MHEYIDGPEGWGISDWTAIQGTPDSRLHRRMAELARFPLSLIANPAVPMRPQEHDLTLASPSER